jgi:glycosyltransferase involved in cell wall biosynthesis
MNQYSKTELAFFRVKFALVWLLKKLLTPRFVDLYIEPVWHRLRRLAYKVQYFFVVRIRIRNRKSIIFISGEWMTPGHTYRVERYADTYRELGFQVFWFKPENIFSNPEIIEKCRLLIIWRTEMSENLRKCIQTAKSKGIKVVFDIDDLMFDPELAKSEIIDGIRSMDIKREDAVKMFTNIRDAMDASDIITCPTRFLSSIIKATGKEVFVLPNGYNAESLQKAFEIQSSNEGVIRIGYAGGTRTHQRDYYLAVPALARVLNDFPQARLTVFGEALLVDEFEELSPYSDQIEFRSLVPMELMPLEISRFDINLAPLEINPFCESKSELKFFEAALFKIPTIASPTEPYKQAIEHGFNGLLATSADEWYDCIKSLIVNSKYRKQIGINARNSILWNYSPAQRNYLLYNFLKKNGEADSVEISFHRERELAFRMKEKIDAGGNRLLNMTPHVPDYKVIKQYHSGKYAESGVIIPMYNYERFIIETLESVKLQEIKNIDLVVVDDCSTDNSLKEVVQWMERNFRRFNNCAILQNSANSKLGAARNAAFDFINVQYVMQLDADNVLKPRCMALCLEKISKSGAAMVYPQIEIFGTDRKLIRQNYGTKSIGLKPWIPARLAEGNYIDAMAMVSKAAWYKAGGYDTSYKFIGWEDYDMWLRFIELGFFGIQIPEILAKYRVHGESMLREADEVNYSQRRKEVIERHPWVAKYDLNNR